MKGLRAWVLSGVIAIAAPLFTAAAPTPAPNPNSATLANAVRHELVMLPYYGVFDHLTYNVDGNTVTLFGQVVRPVLKSDAQNVVKRLNGVDKVVNNIEVLPLSSFDDSIRMRTLRAIYGFSSLSRYGMGTQPSIHIIVNNGHVTLEGVVDNAADSNVAFLRANGVPGVFSVTNNLRVANPVVNRHS